MKRWIGAKTTRDGARLSVLGGDKCVSPDQEGPSASVKRRATVAKTPVSARALEQTVPGSAGFAPLHSGILTAAFVVTLIAFGRRSRGTGPIAFFGGRTPPAAWSAPADPQADHLGCAPHAILGSLPSSSHCANPAGEA